MTGLGSIRTTIDREGRVLRWSLPRVYRVDDYYPFGLAMKGRSGNSGTPNDLNKFTGHERDKEGGLDLDYMRARNYDPEIGRFMSVDALYDQFPSMSPYNYTFNNPLNLVDPDGNAPCPTGLPCETIKTNTISNALAQPKVSNLIGSAAQRLRNSYDISSGGQLGSVGGKIQITKKMSLELG